MFQSKRKKKEPVNYLENWPEHYYEIEDINEREQTLLAYLREHPDSKDDLRRLEILRMRYGKGMVHNRPDHFMHACLMMRVTGKDKITSLNRRALLKDYYASIQELGADKEPDELMMQEWRTFAQDYLNACMASFSHPQFLGIAKRDTHTSVHYVAENLNILINVLPKQFGMEDKMKPISEILLQEFFELFEDGEEIWSNDFSKSV